MQKFRKLVFALALGLALIAGCGGSTSEDDFHDSDCEQGIAFCEASGECEFGQTCWTDSCHRERGYEDDLDRYYEWECREVESFTLIYYRVEGGPAVRTTETVTEECRYRSEQDYWSGDVTQNRTCTSGIYDFETTGLTCEPVPCRGCKPVCR